MDDDGTQKAAKVRERGNSLYRNGRLGEAMKAYLEAVKLVPDDPAPLSNISAAKFEAGNYSECIKAAQQALSMLKDEPETQAIRQRLLVRSARAYLYLSQASEARELLRTAEASKDVEEVKDLLDAHQDPGWSNVTTLDSTLLLDKLFYLPRLRPSIQDEPEHYGPGHDDAESQYTTVLKKSSRRDPVLSFMFCGIGDARHLFHTIRSCAARSSESQKVHFTILDIKPAVLARALVFFKILDQAYTSEDQKSLASLSLGYLFCAHMIPPFVWDVLQETIQTLEACLDQSKQPFTWVYVPPQQMELVSRVLKTWGHEPTDQYAPEKLRRLIREDIDQTTPSPPMMGGPRWMFLPEYVAEHEFFDDFSVMLPPDAVLSKFEPELSDLVAEHRNGSGKARSRIDKYLDKHWRWNTTLIDSEWEAKKEGQDAPEMGFDPFNLIEALTKPSSGQKFPIVKTVQVMTRIQHYFERISECVLELQGKVMVETIVGDMAEVLERIRYGLLDRPNPMHTSREKIEVDWPHKYHVVHLSNIPDYVGGSLSSFLYAAPLLKEGTGTGLKSCVLRNTPQWNSTENFNAEHLLMYDHDLLLKHFSVKLAKSSLEKVLPGFERFIMPLDFPLVSYTTWERRHDEDPTVEQLLNRASLERWLHAHFLKLCLPFPRPHFSDVLVYAPLNMTASIRILVHAASLYPRHWIFSIIAGLSTGSISTTARAPRKYILNRVVVDKVHEPRTISIQPWTAEFTTLVTMWSIADRLGLVAPRKLLPAPGSIRQYSVTFPPFRAADLSVPHFAMVFWNTQKYGEPPERLRTLLLDDEKGDTTTSAAKIRADGTVVLSTLGWVSETYTASFWLRSDTAEAMARDRWTVYIWRIDSWTRLTKGLPLREALVRGNSWVAECGGRDEDLA
ncbi:hypothetical protein F5X99DRAFT_389871 [Biscogniauxia marginata]|nr:hypothetical protein F5X99DRAFT_389871 [Biscogniauxia marginata]